jgi:hypothetical protein
VDDPEHGSRIDLVRAAPDAGTLLRIPGEEARLASAALADAWRELVPGLAQIPPREPRAGHRLFWRGRGETGFRDFFPRPGAHLIVGRHTACDVVLAGDGEISLRHLLLVPARGARDAVESGEGENDAGDAPARDGPGSTALRLVDLQGSMPMLLEDDSAQRSLLVEGPFAVRLGRYVLGGFAIGPGALAPPGELPLAEHIDLSGPGEPDEGPAPRPTERPEPSQGPYRSRDRERERSVITMLPRPVSLLAASSANDGGSPVGLLGAARDGERLRISVSREALRAGVLVGRADKCDAGLRPLLTERVSRVHLVILELDGRTVLYDCASTNGTYCGGRRVRSLELGLDPPVVRLAADEGVELRWTPLVR